MLQTEHTAPPKQIRNQVITKSHLKRARKVETATAERDASIRVHGHPGIVSLYHTFQDDWSLYFRCMQSLLFRLGSLFTRCVQYYAAQIADAMDDLKPENLLLDDAFRIKITDFGTGKVLENGGSNVRRPSLVQHSTRLQSWETTKSSDYWAFGCIRSDYLTWQTVRKVEYAFPNGFDEQAKDLVQQLLVHDPLKRLAAGPRGSPNGPGALKSHMFFASISWTSLWTDSAPQLNSALRRCCMGRARKQRQ
ncbi:kinase-like domain-containing protein [Mycena galericulata]|nr:kinase-like domain-containing protein [Mycena galericulata]